jgi:CrcB protein
LTLLGSLCVFIGGGIGALLRWGLALLLTLSSLLPIGTLTANLAGGYLIGVAAAFFALRQDLPREWQLLTITGLLGGFTTFSAFSYEVISLLGAGRPGWAMLTAAAHLAGSLALTALGFLTVRTIT